MDYWIRTKKVYVNVSYLPIFIILLTAPNDHLQHLTVTL